MPRRRAHGPRRPVVALSDVLAGDASLAAADALWRAEGYAVTSGRLWRCRDGSFTARLVWRKRDAVVSTVTYTVRGLILG